MPQAGHIGRNVFTQKPILLDGENQQEFSARQDKALNVVHLSSRDGNGGAGKVAFGLHKTMIERGHRSFMVAGEKTSNRTDIVALPNFDKRSWLARTLYCFSEKLKKKGQHSRIRHYLRTACFLSAEPIRHWSISRGKEDFCCPASRQFLNFIPFKPDILHCHNLHGNYFDLRVLPELSRQIPTVITLHDEWLFTGHCAYTMNCERWRTGCGRCPDLDISPSINRDATAYNWKRKRKIYEQSALYIIAPSQWLFEKVQRSILGRLARGIQLIPNGIDLSIFKSYDRKQARLELGLPLSAKILLFAANHARTNPYKDFSTIYLAFKKLVAQMSGTRFILMILGERAPLEKVQNSEIRYYGYIHDAEKVARFFQAADLYLHAAHGENASLAIMEALACGIPVIATAVGGIPGQIKSLEEVTSADKVLRAYGPEEATGIILSPRDPDAMTQAVKFLLQNNTLAKKLSENALQKARARFDLNEQVSAHLDWYRKIIFEKKRETA